MKYLIALLIIGALGAVLILGNFRCTAKVGSTTLWIGEAPMLDSCPNPIHYSDTCCKHK